MKKTILLFLIFILLFSLSNLGIFSVKESAKADSYQWVAINNGLKNTHVKSLVIDPTNTNIIYAGTQDGVYKSTNGGINWAPINNVLTNLEVNCLLIDSQHTNTIYAGTGVGIFKTIDGGENWVLYSNGLKATSTVFPPHPSIYSLAMDHQYTNTIYAGTGVGIFKTINGGENWTWLNGDNSVVGPYQPFPGPNIWSIATNPNDSNIIYATVGAEDRGVYKSTNGGQKWTWIENSAVIGYFTHFIIIDPNDSNIIYATGKGIYKSTDSGLNWTQIGLTDVTVNSLAIDPTNTNIIYAGTKNSGIFKYTSQHTIILHIGNSNFTVNSVSQEIDAGRGTKPVIIPEWSRTVVPIRAIVEALGGTIEWDGIERKVIINFDSTTIELWIDNPKARVNGTEVYIDPNNHSVKPIIINDRTMLPLRFVAESLGCDVGWEGTTQTITITHGG